MHIPQSHMPDGPFAKVRAIIGWFLDADRSFRATQDQIDEIADRK